jgi:hypothetical protein
VVNAGLSRGRPNFFCPSSSFLLLQAFAMDAADGVIDGRSFGANVAAPMYGAAPVYAPGYGGMVVCACFLGRSDLLQWLLTAVSQWEQFKSIVC